MIGTDTGRQLSNRGRLEHVPHRDAGIQTGVDRRDQAHRRQRIPTQLEERLVHAYQPGRLNTQDLGVDAGQDLLHRIGWGTVVIAILIFRCRQRAGVEFAVDRQRQRRQHHDGRGHHVHRQPLGQRRAYPGRFRGPGHIPHQALVAGTVLTGDHHRLLDAVQPTECCLDFAEFDAIAADLDLLVSAPHIPQLAIGAPPHQIPGAIHPLSWRSRASERARHKPRRTQPRPTHVAGRQPGAGHIQLPDHSRRHRLQPAVEHEEPKMGQRHPDRAERVVHIAGNDLPERRMHRRLGDAIHIDQPRRPRMAVQPPPQARRLQRLTAKHHRLELQLTPQLRLQRIGGLQRIKRRRSLAQHSDLFSHQHRVQILRRAHHRIGHHHQPPAVKQRPPDLPHRKIERQRMTLRPHLPRQVQIGVQSLQQPRRVAVRDRHPLRGSRRPRGVNDVRDIVGGRHRQSRAGLASHSGIANIDHRQVTPVQPVGQTSRRDRSHRRGITKHKLNPGRRHARIDRHVRRARFHHRQHRHDRLSRPRQQQRHPLPRTHTPSNQHMRQPVRRLIELPVRHRQTLEGHRQRVGCACHLRGEHLRNRHPHTRLRQPRPITPALQPSALILIQHIHRRQPPPRISGHRRQHALESLHQCFDVADVENVGVEFDAKAQFVAWQGLDRQGIVVVFAVNELGDGQTVDARQCGGVERIVFVHEQGVEQVVKAGDAVDLVERQVLVLECVAVRGLQLIEQVGGSGGSCDVRPHRHRVDEQAHHRVRAHNLGGPARDRRTEGDIVPAGQPRQQL